MRGFTLLEVMIVVVVIGILAAIAYPSYQEYVRRTNRGDMQTEMMRISQEAQRYYTINKRYNGMTMANLGYTGVAQFPRNGAAHYTLNVNTTPSPANPANHTAWELIATPVAGSTQANDGTIRLNSQGHKCWTKGSDCALSATTTWSTR